MRHDNLRDLMANLLSRVVKDVETEPALTPVPSEVTTGNTGSEARLDIRARGFWRSGQQSYYDIRVTNPFSATGMKSSVENLMNHHEKEKKRLYKHRVQSNEHGTFTPLVFTVFGTLSKECNKFITTLCQKLSEKGGDSYEDVMNWLRVKVSFLCLKSCIMCLRGTRVKAGEKVYVSSDFALDGNNAFLH